MLDKRGQVSFVLGPHPHGIALTQTFEAVKECYAYPSKEAAPGSLSWTIG